MPITTITNSKNENSITKFILSVDRLGLTPQFLIERKKKYNTLSGGILSIMIYIISLLACFFFGKELYLKADPTVILSKNFDKDPRLFNLTAQKFNFFVGVQGVDFLYYIDPSIYTLKIGLNQITSNKKPNGEIEFKYDFQHFDLELCNLNKHFKYFKHAFENQDMVNLLCLDQEKEEFQSVPLLGSFGDKNYQYVEFIVSSCKNGTNPGIVCKPKEMIDKKMEGGFFVVNYIETIFDPKNFSNPENRVRRNFYTSMSNKYFKEITFWMKNVDYISDSGILMSSEETKNFLQTDNIKEIYDFRTSTETFISAVIRLSYTRDVVKRRYLKLQDVIEQVGGFIKGIMIIVAVFNHFYSTTNFYIFLMNKQYAFDNLAFINFDKNDEKNNDFYDIVNQGGGKATYNRKNVFQCAKHKKPNIFNKLNKQDHFNENPENYNLYSSNNNNSELNQIKKAPDEHQNDFPYEMKNKDVLNQKNEVFSFKKKNKNEKRQQPKKELEKDSFRSVKNAEHDYRKSAEKSAVKCEISKHLNLQVDSNLNTVNNTHRLTTLNNINNNVDLDNFVKTQDIIHVESVRNLHKVRSAYTNRDGNNNISKIRVKKFQTDIIKNHVLDAEKDIQEKENLHKKAKKIKYLENEENTEEKANNNVQTIGLKELEEERSVNPENNYLDEGRVISEKIVRYSEDILDRINTRQLVQTSVIYNFWEKILFMFSLCFSSQSHKDFRSKKSLRQQKQFIFEESYNQITEKFDAFKYLKIFDDLDLIKNILFTEDQINVIDLISKARLKYQIKQETPIHFQHKSLRNIGESTEEIDMKIKMILRNTHLL